MRNPSTGLTTGSQKRLRAMLAAVAVGLPLLDATVAGASETITYAYDARGRLIAVVHSGGPSSGKTTSYALDKADNRTAKTTN